MLTKARSLLWMSILAFIALSILFLSSAVTVEAGSTDLGYAIAPGAFNKTSPGNALFVFVPNPTLTWGASTGATRYEYCVDNTNNNQCDSTWINRATNLNAPLTGLLPFSYYYWQVRAFDASGGVTYANGGAWWFFKVSVPTGFNKLSPANNSVLYISNPTLKWQTSLGAVRYEYCVDDFNNNFCDEFWHGVALNQTVTLSGLAEGTYYWQVRAVGVLGTTEATGTWWSFRLAKPGSLTKLLPPRNSFLYSPNYTLTSGPSAGARYYEYCIDTVANTLCDTTWVNRGTNLNIALYGMLINTTFYWQVRAVNDIGVTYANNGEWWKFTTSPPKGFLKVTPINNAIIYKPTLTFTWQAAAGATRYEFCIDTVNNNTCDTGWVNRAGFINHTITNLEVNKTYYWQVRAIGEYGVWTYANNGLWWAFKTSMLPNFVRLLPANNGKVYSNSTLLTWTPSAGAILYETCIDMINNNTCDATWIQRGTSTSTTVYGLIVGKIYYWQVRALGPFGYTYANQGVWGIFTTSYPGMFVKISPPTGKLIYAPSLTLTWGAAAGASRYEYCIDMVNNNACDTTWISRALYLNAPILLLTPNTTYYWQVRAVNTFGYTYANSGEWWTIKTAPPGAFVKISPVNGALVYKSTPTLIWQAAAGATRYEYCYDKTNNSACDGTWVSTGMVVQATIGPLDANSTYYWQVRAVGSFGTTYANGGAWWAFKTQPPTAFVKISPVNAATVYVPNPTLTWQASVGATRYEYCIDTVNNNACDTTWVNRGLTLNAPVAGLVSYTRYYWQVRAVGGFGVTYANSAIWWSFYTSQPKPFSKSYPINNGLIYMPNPTIKWQAAAGAASYEYCIDTVNNNICDTTWVNRGLSLNAPIAGLVVNTNYYWQVRAVGGFGTTYANTGIWWPFRTSMPLPFSKVTPIHGMWVFVANPTLTWQGTSGATRFDYCIDTVNNNACDTGWVNRGAALNVPLSNLVMNTTYYWQVRAVGGFGITYANNGAWWSFKTTTPLAFNKVSPNNGISVNTASPTLTWQASIGMLRYEYCIDSVNNNICDTVWVSRALALNAPLAGLTNGTTYYWQVRAVGGFGPTLANGGAWWSFKVVIP